MLPDVHMTVDCGKNMSLLFRRSVDRFVRKDTTDPTWMKSHVVIGGEEKSLRLAGSDLLV